MKVRVPNGQYTFTASAGTISFDSYVSIEVEGILLITNVVDNIIIYEFENPLLGGTVAGNILTLTYSTVAMADTDELQIWYEDGSQTQAVSGTVIITQPVSVDDNAGSLTVDDGGASITVDGPLTDIELRATPVDVTGTVTITPSGTQDVNIVSTIAVPVTDNGGSLTVDGAVTANAGTNLNTSALALETTLQAVKTSVELIDNAIAGSELQVDVVSSALPSGAAIAANQQTDALTNTQLRAVPVPVSGTVTVTGAGDASAANQATEISRLTDIKTAVEIIDNFISGARGLVTEDNSGAIKTAVETIDNFISGSRGLVTEDNSAAIKTSVELIDDAVYTDGSGTVTKGVAILGQDGTNPQAIKTDASGELQIDVLTLPAIPAGTNNIGDVDVLSQPIKTPNKTQGTSVLSLQNVTASTVVLGSAIDASGKFGATIFIRFGRRIATASTAGANIRVEASYKSSGDNSWVPLAIFTTNFAACEGEAVSGTVASGQKVITVASTTNLTAGDLIYIDNATPANSEWARIKSIVTNTSVTVEDDLVNAATGATIYDSAELYLCQLDLSSIGRIRVVHDASLYTQVHAIQVDMITLDSIV